MTIHIIHGKLPSYSTKRNILNKTNSPVGSELPMYIVDCHCSHTFLSSKELLKKDETI